MNHAGKLVIVATGGVVIMLLLVIVGLSGMSASLAWTNGGGSGSDPMLCSDRYTHHGDASPRWLCHKRDDFRHTWKDSDDGWHCVRLCASECDRRAGGGLGAQDGRRALCQSSLWWKYQLSRLLRYLVQSAGQQLSTRRAQFSTGGDPVRATGLSRLRGLGQWELPVCELRAWGLLPGLSHDAHRQRL